ncbi:MAG: efflux RND transporter permease subunit [Polyangiaceae bacterium]|nr:efflux RND transporter permease subunit [Polyangiaceae bacterium]
MVRRGDGDPDHPDLHAGSAIDAHQCGRFADEAWCRRFLDVRARLHAEHDDAARPVARDWSLDRRCGRGSREHLQASRAREPQWAALNGTKEIALSVLATTMTIVAVFVPVAFMTGIVGQFSGSLDSRCRARCSCRCSSRSIDPMLSSRFSKTIAHGAKIRSRG